MNGTKVFIFFTCILKCEEEDEVVARGAEISEGSGETYLGLSYQPRKS